MDVSRRGFLFGRNRPAHVPIRPPWSLVEKCFLETCTRCGGCTAACPTRIIVIDNNSFPFIDFLQGQGECTFCGECVAVCTAGALRRDDQGRAPWRLAPQIGADCVAQQNVVCRSCGDICTAQAIRFRPRLGGAALPEPTAELCTSCGACVSVCPARVITMKSNAAMEGAA